MAGQIALQVSNLHSCNSFPLKLDQLKGENYEKSTVRQMNWVTDSSSKHLAETFLTLSNQANFVCVENYLYSFVS